MESGGVKLGSLDREEIWVMRWAGRSLWRNLLLLALVVAYTLVVYTLTNAHPTRRPVPMPFILGEESIPILPWTAWIYLSYFALLLYTGIRLVAKPHFARVLAVFFGLVTVSGLVFLLFPTTVPREAIPESAPFAWLLAFLRGMDPPNDCFPSMHVGMAVACALIFRRAGCAEWPAIALWSLLIAISTITTRQHCLLDVFSGALVGAVWFILLFPPRPSRARAVP
jgi:membrane-associated phospholipid phosphatase